ncbi:hypothetical protein CC85DRAFT_119993 [Cutaneotrichosporon oleaginosum]|uniref:CAP-Gly domain-containing protein n=1 Tax=Cutaneotrichosporon oleaginosum TaxID=879819 RepID=A0A0J0XK95_9TREE|nr:uncharacterized protein CC85DRAFT_119993 [Cutaneotrichosporon oleaginosum]KLT41510.1 hypothetical protein CC85DRAFT_119993 [Cutaneotrichosporon oleaginosum]TXT05841.1 hypothetical protein COLE_07161 [Cutaneotrichosporon oleaginosum]
MCEYAVGRRYLNARTRAPLTLRYIGALPGLDSTWLGVEYDDPTRGKHSGEYNSVQFFRCHPGAGAFIKYSSASLPLVEGADLVAALEDRYGGLEGEGANGREGADVVLLGDSRIVVEAPGMRDVVRRIGRLERLREVGFENEWVSRLGGSERQRIVLKQRLKGVRALDLSRNLIATWSDVGDIASHLTGLRVLILNHSRIQDVSSIASEEQKRLRDCFSTVSELHLGKSALSWAEAVDVASLFPSLETLFLNHNSDIVTLSPRHDQNVKAAMARLKVLSIDGCGVDSWSNVACGLSALPSLTTAQLSELGIRSISPRGSAPAFPYLTGLTLVDTHISMWADIDRLDDWTSGRLQKLRISCAGCEDGVPKQNTDPLRMSGDVRSDRPLLIAKLAALKSLNGSNVTSAERWDSELFYIHYVDRLPAAERDAWGRYTELIQKHDVGPKAPPLKVSSNLKSKMISKSAPDRH